MKKNYWMIAIGMVWTVVFATMSFYWAMGGLIGARSLGGSIYGIIFCHHFMVDRYN